MSCCDMKNCTSASDLAPWGAVSGSVGRETTHPWGAVLCCEVARGGGSRDGGRESPASECLIVVAGGGRHCLGCSRFLCGWFAWRCLCAPSGPRTQTPTTRLVRRQSECAKGDLGPSSASQVFTPPGHGRHAPSSDHRRLTRCGPAPWFPCHHLDLRQRREARRVTRRVCRGSPA